MQIAIISDTHMPRGARRLPEACVERLRAGDLILHAGDLMRLSVLAELESYGRVYAVHGNVDDEAVRAVLPERRIVEAGGVRIGMIHDAGPAPGRLRRLRARFAAADARAAADAQAAADAHAHAVIFGHSHMPLHERAPDGFQIFNPGSPTERRRAPVATMGLARVADGAIAFELVELGLTH